VTEHEKKRLTVGVELENRRTIGFHRQPVQEPKVKPVIQGLPNALRGVYWGRG
jgi:hypothetical protein